MLIRDVLARDLKKPIEEVVKLSQADEQTVYDEITEYVATERIKRQYIDVLQAMADAPGEPTEGVGVWVSGFFGSGKSSFAKNLGYILANHSVRDTPAAELFMQQLERQSPGDRAVATLRHLIDFLDARLDTQVIMFDVQVDRAVKRATEPLAEIMYTVLLRELDYAQDYAVAELEIELESEGRLAEFVQTAARLFRDEAGAVDAEMLLPKTVQGQVAVGEYRVWQRIRKGAQRISRASAILHALAPQTYPTAEAWAATQRGEADITIQTLVDRTFDLAAQRRPGHGVVFIIDEVGQYVARSVDKIEGLRAVVEQFGVQSKNRVQARQAVAPVWVIVTSQEKLDEVVAAIDDKRVELPKLQDRFRIRVDMAPADIREVATRRVLAKKPSAVATLERVYERDAALLQTHTKLERTARRVDIDRARFIEHYPYLPHFIDLSIDIVSGIRLLRSDAPRHIGGSNRTIIKQAYEMLVGPRTGLADKPIGALVTLDRIYDLVEGNLPSERQRDIADIQQRWPDTPWPARVAKAILLLEYVRDLPRTDVNLAALLYDELGAASPLPQVQDALAWLRDAQFIHETESGWKLLTQQEKNWSTRRSSFAISNPERKEIVANALRSLFTEPSLSVYHRQARNFRVGVSWDGRALVKGEAQIPVSLRIADDPSDMLVVGEEARNDTRRPDSHNDLVWVIARTPPLDSLVDEVFRSKSMVGEYEQLRAQNKIQPEEAASLEQEKRAQSNFEQRLRDGLERALAQGHGFFQGVEKPGPDLGRSLGESWKAFFDYAMPKLYGKLDLGARALKGNEPEEVLRAANLNGLSKVFYAPPDGLDLVTRQGDKYVVNQNAPIVKEVAEYLAREHSYGNKVTGKALEGHFGGLGYGWTLEVVQLVLATLLRAGAIEVTYQGRRFRNHVDPQARAPFSGANAFRSASFAPRKAPDLQTLVTAARRYEQIEGEEVDVDETMIAQAFQRLARQEMERLLPVRATARAYDVPVDSVLQEYQTTLETIVNSASDDVVNMLAGEGTSFQGLRQQVEAIRQASDDKGMARLRQVRAAAQQLWPALEREGVDGQVADAAAQLREALEADSYFPVSPGLAQASQVVERAYHDRYADQHRARAAAYARAIEDVRGRPEWTLVPEELRDQALRPLTERRDSPTDDPEDPQFGAPDLSGGELVCRRCRASLAQMASDLAAVDGLRAGVLRQVQELTTPEEPIERVRLADIAGIGLTLSDEAEVDDFLARLRDSLVRLVATGIKVVVE